MKNTTGSNGGASPCCPQCRGTEFTVVSSSADVHRCQSCRWLVRIQNGSAETWLQLGASGEAQRMVD